MSPATDFLGSRYRVSGFPELVAEWDSDRNGTLTPDTVSAGSGRMIWWRCRRGEDHVWRAKPNNRTRGTGCPFCANKRVSRTNNLAACFPRVAAEWHPSNNAPLTPRDVTPGSARIVSWQCLAHEEHTWSTSVANRVLHASGCPRCVRRGRTVTANRQESRPS